MNDFLLVISTIGFLASLIWYVIGMSIHFWRKRIKKSSPKVPVASFFGLPLLFLFLAMVIYCSMSYAVAPLDYTDLLQQHLVREDKTKVSLGLLFLAIALLGHGIVRFRER